MVDITEVRVKLIGSTKDRLKAYCSITIGGNCVIRDLKIIDGTSGLFVAMPSRKLADRCPHCRAKNHLRARHCNECGGKLSDAGGGGGADGRNKLHADIAHPINAECRAFLQSRVIEEYEAEVDRSGQPDYQGSRYDDEDDLEDDASGSPSPYHELIRELKSDRAANGAEESAASEPTTPAASDDEPSPEPQEHRPESSPSPPKDDSFGAGLL